MEIDKNLKFHKFSKETNSAYFVGKKENKNSIAYIKLLPLKKKVSIKNAVQTFKSTRYQKYDASIEHNVELTTIYPALKEDMNKLNTDIRKRIIETPEMYIKNVYPKIIKQDLSWIQDILTGKTEKESILYKDEQFILMPDLKWNKKDMDNLYCLAIVQDSNIRSVRDLNEKHISLLENIYKKGLKIIKDKYNIEEHDLRVYVHYHPSWWHLHIHFNLVKKRLSGAVIDISISLLDIINNIKLVSNYYQIANLEIIQQK